MKRYGGRGLEGSEYRNFCLHKVGVHYPLAMGMCLATRSSLNPIVQGLLWRPHHIGMIDYYLSLQALFSPQRQWGTGAESSKLLIMCFIPLASSP